MSENKVCGAIAGGRLVDLADELKAYQVNPEEMAKREAEAKREFDRRTAIIVLNFLEVGGANQGTYLGASIYGPFCNELKEMCIRKLAEGVK